MTAKTGLAEYVNKTKSMVAALGNRYHHKIGPIRSRLNLICLVKYERRVNQATAFGHSIVTRCYERVFGRFFPEIQHLPIE